MPKQNFGEAKSPFSLKSGNNIGGRNGKGVSFKTMGSPVTYRGPKPESPESSEVKKASISDSFKSFMKSEQTEEGRKIGDIKYAKSPARKAKKAQNQRIGQRSDSDLHHTGSAVKRVSIKNNRGNYGRGTKNE